MKVLVTGAKGFVGKNLVCALNNLKDGKDRTRPNIKIDEVYEYDIDSNISELDEYCKNADFVFNLAGVNRPKGTFSPAYSSMNAPICCCIASTNPNSKMGPVIACLT